MTTRVHIHAPQPDTARYTIRPCFTCKVRRRHLLTMTPYYGADLHCLTCGDSWSNDGDGWGRHGRPAKRNWRQEEVARLRAYAKRIVGKP